MADDAVSRSFVLGLDGVPWNLLARWAEAGELPHVKELLESGASGPLESTMPPTTAIAWPSIATGVRADKHGIYAFRRLTSEYGREINTSTALREPPVWEILSPAVVANVPMTYPASAIDGTMVTGMMTPDRDAGFTHPADFGATMDREVPDYEIGLAWHEYHGQETAFRRDLDAMVAARRALMRRLMDEPDWRIFFFVYTAPDRLQHLIWDLDVILDHYRTLDDIIGEVMAYVEEQGANLFVVSDHGFGPVEESIHVNRLLADAGYLRRRDDDGARGVASRLGIRRERIRAWLDRAGIEDRLLASLPDRVIDDVATRIPGAHGMYDVDFEHTSAFAFSGRSIYVNDALRFEDGVVPPAARDGVKSEVRARLETATHPRTGESLFTVYDGSDLFPTDPQAPDLVVEGTPGTEVKSALDPSLVTPTTGRAASHRRTGIFLAWGPNIESTAVAGATVYDVLPSVLQSQGEAIPRDVDGEVLEIFRTGSAPATSEPRLTAYRRDRHDANHHADFDDVEDRLRGLGYLE